MSDTRSASRVAGLAGVLLYFAAVTWGADTPAPATNTVREIIIRGTRVRESVIRRELTFREGDALTADAVEESRKNLNRLGLFKALDVTSEWDPEQQGQRVTIKARDGWFVLPLPMVGSRGGDLFYGLLVMEQNVFRRSEGIMQFVSYAEGAATGMLGVFLPRLWLMGGAFQAEATEYAYADGAYSAKDFGDPGQYEEPEDFGRIRDEYEKDIEAYTLSVGHRLLDRVGIGVGFERRRLGYDEAWGAPPDDAGDLNSLRLSLDYGDRSRALAAGDSGFMGGFGRMFGLGMSSVGHALVRLPKPETARRFSLSVERGDEALGSDEEYTKLQGAVHQTTLFRDWSALTLAVRGGVGESLPPSQMFATSRQAGLYGVYAREYRGDYLLSGGVRYHREFFRNRVGYLGADAFLDLAGAWDGDEYWTREGIGLNLAYRFWRFPLPLGLGWTYCADDNNVQVSFAIGSML